MAARFSRGKQPKFSMHHIGARKLSNQMLIHFNHFTLPLIFHAWQFHIPQSLSRLPELALFREPSISVLSFQKEARRTCMFWTRAIKHVFILFFVYKLIGLSNKTKNHVGFTDLGRWASTCFPQSPVTVTSLSHLFHAFSKDKGSVYSKGSGYSTV